MKEKELDINTVMDKLIRKELTISEVAKRIYKIERYINK